MGVADLETSRTPPHSRARRRPRRRVTRLRTIGNKGEKMSEPVVSEAPAPRDPRDLRRGRRARPRRWRRCRRGRHLQEGGQEGARTSRRAHPPRAVATRVSRDFRPRHHRVSRRVLSRAAFPGAVRAAPPRAPPRRRSARFRRVDDRSASRGSPTFPRWPDGRAPANPASFPRPPRTLRTEPARGPVRSPPFPPARLPPPPRRRRRRLPRLPRLPLAKPPRRAAPIPSPIATATPP